MERDSQRVEFFDHLNEGVGVWEGDFKDSRNGGKFQMIVNIPAYGEPLEKYLDLNIDYGIDTHSDDQSVAEDSVIISKMEDEGYDFEEPVLENRIEPERLEPENFDEESFVIEDDKIVENNNVEPNEIV